MGSPITGLIFTDILVFWHQVREVLKAESECEKHVTTNRVTKADRYDKRKEGYEHQVF